MLESIIDIVRRAGELIRSANDVTAATHEKNGPADLVTEYDLAVQRFLRQELLALLPEADFFGEEGQHDALTSPWTFIVDPIDGTTNFVRGAVRCPPGRRGHPQRPGHPRQWPGSRPLAGGVRLHHL